MQLARLHKLTDPDRRVIDIRSANGAPSGVHKAEVGVPCLNSANTRSPSPVSVLPRQTDASQPGEGSSSDEPTAVIPSVDWWITSRCNLRCDFCYGPERGKDPVRDRDAIVDALAHSAARVVTFCGGEPLLVGRIGDYAETLAKARKSVVLNTNGQLLGRLLMPRSGKPKLRLADFAVIGISVDGSTLEIHRSMRGEKAQHGKVVAAARLVGDEPGVRLKLATVVSSVNRDDLPALAEFVRDLKPDVWRLYQYSRRGEVNTGQLRHRLPDDEFRRLADLAGVRADPVPTAPSSETETEGCLIVDPTGNVLQPAGDTYIPYGNCLKEPLDDIWGRLPARSAIVSNKRWLSVLG